MSLQQSRTHGPCTARVASDTAARPRAASARPGSDGPLARFAQQLRELRERAGSPSYREMQVRCHVSYASLYRATTGRKLPTWLVTKGFVVACGGDPAEWRPRWDAAREAARDAGPNLGRWPSDRPPSAPGWAGLGGPPMPTTVPGWGTLPVPPAPSPRLPDPSSVHTVAELRGAVTDILREHDLGVVSTTMRAQLGTVRELSRRPELADLPTFQEFLRACGAGQAEVLRWTATWHAVLASMREQEPSWPDPAVAPPDPAAVRSYDDLLRALHAVQAAAGVSAAEIERRCGGRLPARRTVEILDGSQAATGEEYVLLLRACGLRAEVPLWVEAWVRIGGASLGRPAGPLSPAAMALVIAAVTVVAVLLAWLV